MLYTLSAIILACKFSICGYLPYSEFTTNPTACITLSTRITSIALRNGFINARVVNCQMNRSYFQ